MCSTSRCRPRTETQLSWKLTPPSAASTTVTASATSPVCDPANPTFVCAKACDAQFAAECADPYLDRTLCINDCVNTTVFFNDYKPCGAEWNAYVACVTALPPAGRELGLLVPGLPAPAACRRTARPNSTPPSPACTTDPSSVRPSVRIRSRRQPPLRAAAHALLRPCAVCRALAFSGARAAPSKFNAALAPEKARKRTGRTGETRGSARLRARGAVATGRGRRGRRERGGRSPSSGDV